MYRPDSCIQLQERRWRCLTLTREFSCTTPIKPAAEIPYAEQQTVNQDKPHHVRNSHCPFPIRRVENSCAIPEKMKNSSPPPMGERRLLSVFQFESTSCTPTAPNRDEEKGT